MKLMLDTKLQSEEYKFYFLFFLALMFFFSMVMPISYGDLGVWIAEGRQIFQQGTLYIHDAYSFNPTETRPYPWLSSLIYYFLDTNFAVESIFILHRLIPVAIVAFWLKRYPVLMEKKSIAPLTICIVGISMLIVDRPALLVFPLIPYFYELIESGRIHHKKIKSLLLLVLWTNLHGSFSLFLLLLSYKSALQILKKPKMPVIKERLLFIIYAFLATLINPWGIKIYSYVLETAAVSKMRLNEWKPLWSIKNGGLSFELTLFTAAFLILIIFTAYKKKITELLYSLLPPFILASLLAVRNLPLFYAVLPLFWGKYIADPINVHGFAVKANNMKVLINRLVVTVLIVVGVYMFTDYSSIVRPRYDNTSSFRIAEYLNNSAGKKIFNEWILGSFLMSIQENKIFIDTRNIIYTDKTYGDYVKIMQNQNGEAENLLNEYQIDYVVSEKDHPLNKALQSSASWNFIMDDNGYVLFEKK